MRLRPSSGPSHRPFTFSALAINAETGKCLLVPGGLAFQVAIDLGAKRCGVGALSRKPEGLFATGLSSVKCMQTLIMEQEGAFGGPAVNALLSRRCGGAGQRGQVRMSGAYDVGLQGPHRRGKGDWRAAYLILRALYTLYVVFRSAGLCFSRATECPAFSDDALSPSTTA